MTRPDGTPARGARRRQHRRGPRAPRRRPRLRPRLPHRRRREHGRAPAGRRAARRRRRRRPHPRAHRRASSTTRSCRRWPPRARPSRSRPGCATGARSRTGLRTDRARRSTPLRRPRGRARATSTRRFADGCSLGDAAVRPARRRARHRQEPPGARARSPTSTRAPRWSPGARAAACPTARASPSGRSAEIVKAHAGILDTDDVAIRRGEARGGRCPRARTARGSASACAPCSASRRPQAAREENFAAWLRFLEQIAAAGPTVLVFEDLHWADEALLAFVEHLAADALGGAAAPRRHDAPRAPAARTRDARRRARATAHVDPFAAARLATRSRPGRGTPRRRSLPRTSARRSSSAPAATRSTPRSTCACCSTAACSCATSDGLHLRAGEELPLPDTVQAVLAARLDTLPPEHKALLCDAAVFGETFWRGGVAALSGARARTTSTTVMADARRSRSLVRPVVTSSFEGEPEYLFWHALAARRRLRPAAAQAARAQASGAAALDRGDRPATGGDEFAEILAHHYVTALGPGGSRRRRRSGVRVGRAGDRLPCVCR